jgi:TrmH family RNA methyltransferase
MSELNLPVLSRTLIVLHRPIYPRNIGMCARAMANLGSSDLHIISPRCDWTSSMVHHELRQGATHGAPVLEAAKVHATLQDFLDHHGQGIRFGFSAREGFGRRIHDFSTLVRELDQQIDHPIHSASSAIQLHFGTEDDGLSLEELEPMNFIVRLPTSDEVPSLNLSHAVLLAQYILRDDFQLASQTAKHTANRSEAMENALPPGRLEYPRKAIRDWLEELGFDLDSRKISIETSLNRVLLSHCPTPDDVRLLEKVLFQTVAKLKAKGTT